MSTLITLSVLGFLALLSEIFNFKKLLPAIAFLGIIIAFCTNTCEWNTNVSYYNHMMVFDNFAVVFTGLILIIAFLWFIHAHSFFDEESSRSDHYALIFFSMVGAVAMVSFSNLTMLFLGIEILSIPMYVLAGSHKKDVNSNEAAVKYFLMGSFATGFMLFGIALIYGAVGSFDLTKIGDFIKAGGNQNPILLYGGVLMMIIGLAFKVSAVPFHFWTPDVYDGSPNEVTAFMATIVKVASFAAFFRLFTSSFLLYAPQWTTTLWVIAALTIFTGNLTAVFQNRFKRMLAYSSIAHAGYMLLALLALNQLASSSLLLYSAAYSIATITAFAIMNIVVNAKGNDEFDSFKGLARNNPFLALAMTVSMFSLAGIPPVAGFFAKYLIFSVALQSHYFWLVIIGVGGSVVGVYYYFRVIVAMFGNSDSEVEKIAVPVSIIILLIITTILTVLLGLFPSFVIDLLQ